MILICDKKKKFIRCKSYGLKCKSSSDLSRSKYRIQKISNLMMCSSASLCIKYMNRLFYGIIYNSFNKYKYKKNEDILFLLIKQLGINWINNLFFKILTYI